MASLIVASMQSKSFDHSVLVIKLACTAHTDGAFTDTYPSGKEITDSELFGTTNPKLPAPYYEMGYRIANILAVNPATAYPTVAAAVTIKDSTGAEIIGAAATDELALATSASATAVLTTTRDITKRNVTGALTVSVGDTGAAANTVDLYIILERY